MSTLGCSIEGSFVNINVEKNLNVVGTLTTISSNTTYEDSLLELSKGTTGSPMHDSGFIIQRGTSLNAFMGWDESADKFLLATTDGTAASSGNLDSDGITVNNAGLVCADIKATEVVTMEKGFKFKNSENPLVGLVENNSIWLGNDPQSIGSPVIDNATNSVGLGFGALDVVTTGDNNTCVGFDAGNTITTGSNNTCIGHNAQASANNTTNEFTLGDASVTTLRCGTATIASVSDRRDKTNIIPCEYGLNFVSKLKPVEYEWNRRILNEGDKSFQHNGTKKLGFIAQDLQEIVPEGEENKFDLVYESNPERFEIKPANLMPIMVKAIQDLQHEKLIQNLHYQKDIQELHQQYLDLKKEFNIFKLNEFNTI